MTLEGSAEENLSLIRKPVESHTFMNAYSTRESWLKNID